MKTTPQVDTNDTYIKKDLILFAILQGAMILGLIGLFMYDRSTNYFGETATAIYSQLVRK